MLRKISIYNGIEVIFQPINFCKILLKDAFKCDGLSISVTIPGPYDRIPNDRILDLHTVIQNDVQAMKNLSNSYGDDKKYQIDLNTLKLNRVVIKDGVEPTVLLEYSFIKDNKRVYTVWGVNHVIHEEENGALSAHPINSKFKHFAKVAW